MKYARLLLAYLMICVYFKAESQNIISKNFTLKDGLPSNEVYCILQAKDGKLWFGTDNGISVFNGFYFTNYTTNDGLLDNTVLKMQEDDKGRIWFGTLNRKVFYYDGSKFIAALTSNNDTLQIPTREILDIKNINNEITYLTSLGAYKILGKRNGFELENYKEYSKNESRIEIKLINDVPVITFRNYAVNDETMEIKLLDGTKSLIFETKFNLEYYNSIFTNCFKIDNNIFLTSGKAILKLNLLNNTIEEYIQKSVIIKANSYENFVVLQTSRSGIVVYNPNDFNKPINELFEGNTITSYIYDSEKGFWASTLEGGVYYSTIIGTNITTVSSELNHNIRKISVINNKLWVANRDGSIFYLDTLVLDKKINKIKQLNTNNHDFKTFEFIGEDILYCLSNSIEFYNSSFKLINRIKPISVRAVSNYSNGVCYIATRDSIYELRDYNLKSIPHKFNEIFSLGYYNDTLLIGTNSGLFYLKNQNKGLVNIPFTKNDRIRKIVNCKNYSLLICTKGNGIIFKHKGVWKNLNERNGLISNNVSDALEDNQGNIYAASKYGISKIEFLNTGLKVTNLNSTHGIINDDVICLAEWKNKIFTGTEDGFFGFEQEVLTENKVKPIVTIDKISTMNQSNDTNIFSYNNNDIKIQFSTNTYRNYGNIIVRYKLKNNDKTYYKEVVKNGQVNLLHLEPGEYNFQIQVANNSGNWSDIASKTFIIKKPYWQQIWFIIGSILIVIVITGVTIRRKLKKDFKRKQEFNYFEYQIQELKNKSLRLQMNPHFLFNALNSIQGLYADGNISSAKNYIQELSKLLRLVLEASKDDLVAIDIELKLVDHYLKLLKHTYSKELSYVIEVSPTLNKFELLIPPLITQAFIENAYLHGISPSKRDGKIIVLIKDLGNSILLVVEDNGIGRVASNNLNKNIKHTSSGIRITEDRINLHSNNSTSNLRIIDLYDGANAIGTKIEIELKKISIHD
jgi:hypothetical protein